MDWDPLGILWGPFGDFFYMILNFFKFCWSHLLFFFVVFLAI